MMALLTGAVPFLLIVLCADLRFVELSGSGVC